jgi:hypothetical protein
MNALKIVVATAALGLIFAGCASDQEGTKASTETLQVEGIAATGYALVGAVVTITDVNGEVLFSGSTNELGSYLAEVDRAAIDMPLSIQVSKGDEQFENIVVELPDVAGGAALTAHLNPITDLGAQAVRAFAADLKGVSVQFCDSLRQARIEALLGEGVQYAAFAHNEAYVAAVAGNENVVPSAEDMILHTLGARAGDSGQTLRQFLSTQTQAQAHLLVNDGSFQAELAVQMQNFGMDSTEIQNGLRNALGGDNADSVIQQMDQIRNQYQNMQIPAECLTAAVQAQIQEVLSLQAEVQNDSANTELPIRLMTAAQNLQATMAQLQSQCEVPFEMPEIPGDGEGADNDAGSSSSDDASSASGSSSETGASSGSGASSASGTGGNV